MLDKSIPYAGLYMRREPGAPFLTAMIPSGFEFRCYNDGDEQSWARIEASVLEFASEFAALMYFKDYFIPNRELLYNRCLFIEKQGGEKVATATAWWSDIGGRRLPWLYWVGVRPEYQGIGLGKAIVARATEMLTGFYKCEPIYLKTQTWSYKAVDIYRKCGYMPTNERALYRSPGDNLKKALRILRRMQAGK